MRLADEVARAEMAIVLKRFVTCCEQCINDLVVSQFEFRRPDHGLEFVLRFLYALPEKHGIDMQTLSFSTSAEFMQWARRIVKYKYQSYDRVPVGKQTWTYGDGHVVESEMGKRGGTMLSNLAFMLQTGLARWSMRGTPSSSKISTPAGA
jgi:hypothetical protein